MSRLNFAGMSTRLTTALMACGMLALVGCGSATDDAEPTGDTALGTYALQDTAHTRNVHVFDNVKRLSDRAAAAVYLDEDTAFFPAEVADELDMYEPGDIMATAAGDGLLRRVESIERQGNQIIVQTSPATLGEVFASGEIYVAAHAEPNLQVPESFRYAPQTTAGEYGVRQQALDLDWSDSIFSWSRDFAPELNDKIKSELGTERLRVDEASVAMDMGGEFYANAGVQLFPPSFNLETLRAGANGTANATLRVSVISDGAFSFDRTYYLASTDPGDNPFKQLDEKEFDIAGLVQLTFSGKSRLDLSASADGTATATGEVQINGNLAGGIERKSGVWQPVTSAGISPSGYAPAFGGEKGFEAQAVLTNTLHMDIADTATGSLTVEPATVTIDFSQDIDLGSGQCPYFFNINVKGNVSGQLASIRALGKDFTVMDSPSSWEMYNKDVLTKDGQVEAPGICDPNYEPPSFGDNARSGGMECREDNDCDGGLTCFRDTCVTEGPLRFSVAWFDDTDVDLQVTTPSGELIDWKNFSHGDGEGFVYDFPQCTDTCSGPAPYVENIYTSENPEPGTYIIEIVHEQERADSDFALLIDHNGTVRNEGGKLPAEGESVRFEYTVD